MSQMVLELSSLAVQKSDVNPIETVNVSHHCVRQGVPDETVVGPIGEAAIPEWRNDNGSP